MRIRAGFVSNSSSTSFLIISRGELEETAFLELMGVSEDSPIADIFRDFFAGVVHASASVNLADVDSRTSPESWFDTDRLSDAMVTRLRKAAGQRLYAYFGKLSSDDTPVQSFFCTDSFEVEDEKVYFNYLECVW